MRRAGFTLVELILVMAILAIIVGLSAPALSRTLRERALEQEAARMHALTEFARSEAISAGSAVVFWIDAKTKRYGIRPRVEDGQAKVKREYALNADVQAEVVAASSRKVREEVLGFSPGGTLELESAEGIRLTDRFGSSRLLARRSDNWGYDIEREEGK